MRFILMIFCVLCISSCNSQGKSLEQLRTRSAPEAKAVSWAEDSARMMQEWAELTAERDSQRRQNASKINFEKFTTPPFSIQNKAKLNFASNKEAKWYITRIKEAYQSDTADFASYYIVELHGCGTDCLMGHLLDTRDGKIYDLPMGENDYCSFSIDKAIYQKNSRLLISNICQKSEEDTSLYYIGYLWNESKKAFQKIPEANFLKGKR